VQLGKLQEVLPEFERLGVRVAAVSADDAEGAQKMVARKGLTFPVLSDPAGTMLKAWQRWDEQQDIALAGTFVVRPDVAVVFFEDDGERYSKRPDVRRLLEVARGL
jgi:peroxiredoxin